MADNLSEELNNIPDELADNFQNYEITLDPGHLNLIVSTSGGLLRTYTFAYDGDGNLTLESQTENGATSDGEVPEEAVRLLEEHPVVEVNSIE